jgi:hypothetical protein
MVAWHEVPGNQQQQPPSRRDGMKRFLRVTNLNTSLIIFIAYYESYRPYGTDHVLSFFQALRARLPSLRPSGTMLSCSGAIRKRQGPLLVNAPGWDRRISFVQAL